MIIALYKTQLIETGIVVGVYILLSYLIRTAVNNYLKHTILQRPRRKMIIKAAKFLILLLAAVFISAIWGLEQNEIAVFFTSMLTVFGIAFFAQWSLLSNITSSILLFFTHPLKIGDTIKVMDKDYPFEGEVTDITYFYLYIKTSTGEIITIPNNQLLQKPVSILTSKLEK
jgi:small-conductance mechanosensitive channel